MIPDDVLKLILEETFMHRISYDSCPSSPCKTASPLLATHVSRRWRRVSTALPTLWTCIHTNLPHDAIALFVGRSQSLPMQLVYVYTASKQSTANVTELIKDNASRWTLIEVEAGLQPDTRNCFDITDGMQLPLLQCITYFGHPQRAAMHRRIMRSAPITPNLKRLTLVRALLQWNSSWLENLHTLHLESTYVSFQILRDLSHTCPNLVELIITKMVLVLAYPLPEDPNSMPSFARLETIRFDLTTWADILRRIYVPRLQTLSCRACSTVFAAPASTKTYPALTRIRLESCVMKGYECQTFHLFHQAPNLTSLELVECTTIPEFFAWLRDTVPARGEPGPALVPQLASVTMTSVEPRNFGAVEEFVCRRSAHRLPLRELRLGAGTVEAMGAELVQRLARMVAVSAIPDPVQHPSLRPVG